MSKPLTIKSPVFHSALGQFGANGRRLPDAVVYGQLRLLVRDILRITPPNQGAMSRKAGENAITGDLARIFKPLSDSSLSAFRDFYGSENAAEFAHKGAGSLGIVRERILSRGEMEAWHQSRRRGDGRVMQVHGQVTTGLRRRDLPGLDSGLVSRRNFEAYLAQVKARVGLLAAGWNAAAMALGVAVPEWILRHGIRQGSYTARIAPTRIQIHIGNRVNYARAVKGLHRRVKHAADNRAVQMQKQTAHFLLIEGARRAGFRVTGSYKLAA